MDLISQKIADYQRDPITIKKTSNKRLDSLRNNPETASDLKKEMQRFLPTDLFCSTSNQTIFREYIVNLMHKLSLELNQII